MKRLLILFAISLVLPQCVVAGEAPADSRSWHDVALAVAKIDALLEKSWTENGITPAKPADDAEFLRRVYLDLAGKIPPVSVTRRFLNDSHPVNPGLIEPAEARARKRREMVDRLLGAPTYVTSFTDFWQSALIPEAESDLQLRPLRPGFEAWLRNKLMDDVAYDDLARELLTSELTNLNRQNRRASEATPDAFFRAKQFKPEDLAAATSRVFLGVRLECAQCHHHPFDTWKREQFWGFAAFYTGIRPAGGNAPPAFAEVSEIQKLTKVKIPDTEQFVEASFLNNEKPEWKEGIAPRQTLADWVTSPKNPRFARTAVNRLWGHFLGRGFVEPVDDFGESNPPTHPEILDILAEEFIRHDFDLKFLIRVIVSSRPYQLTSRLSHDSQEPIEHFALFRSRGLTPRKIFNSLAVALGTFEPFTVPGQFQDGQAETEFLDTFRNESDSVLERPTTILQALVMMNGRLTTRGTSFEESRTLRAIVDYPLMSDREKIETLYLAALTRRPRTKELERLSAFVEKSDDSNQAFADIYWSLLNSSEFLFNH
jgi:hypothetical protein